MFLILAFAQGDKKDVFANLRIQVYFFFIVVCQSKLSSKNTVNFPLIIQRLYSQNTETFLSKYKQISSQNTRTFPLKIQETFCYKNHFI